jgi:anti-sigma factor RsiW
VTELLHHPEDALSALLDAELAGEEALLVQAHVAECPDCAAELDAVREARAAVRSLPAVEPPAGFFDELLADGDVPEVGVGVGARVVPLRPRRMAMANAAVAVAAGVFLVVGFGGHEALAVSPELEGAVAQHASTLSAVSAGLGGPAPTGLVAAPARRSTSVSRPYAAPHELAGYSLVAAFQAPAGIQLLYEKDGFGLSLFEEEGRLDPDRLPGQGRHVRVDGEDGWQFEGGSEAGHVAVVQRGALVVTIVGDESGEVVLAAARGLPGRPAAALGTRLRRACGDALDLLSPTG